MYKKLFKSNSFILLALMSALSLGLFLNSGTDAMFAIKNQNTLGRLFLFAPQDPFLLFGSSLLLSFFYHPTLTHLVLNGILFFFISSLCEVKLNRKKHITLVATCHIATLIVMIIVLTFIDYNKTLLLSGASAATFGLISYYMVTHKKWFTFITILFALFLGQFGVVSIFNVNTQFIDPHLVGYVIGTLLARLAFFSVNSIKTKALL